MKYVFEVVVSLLSKTYGQQLHRVGHDLGDTQRLESEPRFPFKVRMAVENPT